MKIKYLKVLFAIILLLPFYSFASAKTNEDSKQNIISSAGKISIPFIENQGQMDKKVKFYANTFAGNVFITDKADIVYSLTKRDSLNSVEHANLKESLIGRNSVDIHGEEKSSSMVNYFVGNSSNWKNNISSYNTVALGEVYDGIHLNLKAYGKNVEKLFVVDPCGKISDIRVMVEGADGLTVNESGELEVKTELGTAKFTKPVAYQDIRGEKNYIQASYNVSDDNLTYGFKVASYNHDYPVIIDPLLASTFLGGTNEDVIFGIAFGQNGEVYVTGSSKSYYNPEDFPTTEGAYDTTINGGSNVFISKFDSGLTTLSASTFLGGSVGDAPSDIKIDSNGNVIVYGYSTSSDFPTTVGAYNRTYKGGSAGDLFVSMFDVDLSSLLASTFLGGSGNDQPYTMSLDSSDNIIICGQTASSDFQTTATAYSKSLHGVTDGYIAKFNNDLTSLLASTFIGGSSADYLEGHATDSSGNIFVVGYTYSSNYPTTTGVYNQTLHGSTDIFISKLNSTLSSLVASTLIGGTSGEDGNVSPSTAIAIDTSDNVYVTGVTGSSNYPTTTGAYDETSNSYGPFVSKLSNDLTTLTASTYLGSNADGQFLKFDSDGNLFISGYANDDNFPTTAGAFSGTFGGSSDIFISKMNSDLTSLLASTYLGGSSWDFPKKLAIDSFRNIYSIGYTSSSDFPTSTSAYDTTQNESVDGFIAKLDNNLSKTPPVANAGPDQTIQEELLVTLDGTASSDTDGTIASYSWSQAGGVSVSLSDDTASQPTFTAPSIDTPEEVLTFTLTVTDNDGLQNTDSVVITVTDSVPVPPVANAGPDQTVNEEALVQLDGTASSDSDGTISSYLWSQTGGILVTLSDDSASQPTFTSPAITNTEEVLTFTLTVTDNDALQSSDSVVITVTNLAILPVANAGTDQTVNEETLVELDGTASSDSDGTISSYLWSQTGGISVTLSDDSASQPTFTAPAISNAEEVFTFTLTVTDNDGLQSSDNVVVTVTNVCTYTISSETSSFSSSGGNGSATLTTSEGCDWTALSDFDWITITSGDSGSGSGVISFTVSANSGTEQRDGNITAGGQTQNISQQGATPPENSPDLKVNTVVASPNKIKSGKKATIKATIKNIGKKSAAASTVFFYLSSNNNTESVDGDILLGKKSVKLLGKNKSTPVSIKAKINTKSGKYFIKVKCDGNNVVTESNENNNIGVSRGVSVTR
ncbi:MAG: SBBP repeat-containing protein [Candidatus Schekmanbacteria bacterium]|nr:SBBP repeat-containing protein [Candidatus Schekmanbacteria bacterium]